MLDGLNEPVKRDEVFDSENSRLANYFNCKRNISDSSQKFLIEPSR